MMFPSAFGLGFVSGLGVGLVSREILSWGVAAARPVAKAAIGASFALAQRGKENMHRVGESLEDLVAEARADYEEQRGEPKKKTKKASRPTAMEEELKAATASAT